MKTLYLFRHGDAESSRDSDYNRNLSEEGKTMTLLMGEDLKAAGTVIEKIISSGAPRAKVTAETIAEKISYPPENIEFDNIIYDAKIGDELLPLIQKTPDTISSLMIVGHNPVLSDLASSLVDGCKKTDLSKSSAVRIDFDSMEWKDINRCSGKLIFYKKPASGKIETVI